MPDKLIDQIPVNISISGGDFLLSAINKDGKNITVLTALAPNFQDRQLAADGLFTEWSHGQWKIFREQAERQFGNHAKELRDIEEAIRKKKIEEEIPVVEDPFVPANFWAAHTLEVRISRERGLVYIFGQTYPHRDELRNLGFTWSPKTKAWQGPYPSLVQNAIEFVKKYDRKTDPIVEGMSRCRTCGRWTRVTVVPASNNRAGW